MQGAAPKLQGEARKAVEYRGGHLQIIAAAGSGKTEVVSQRVATLLEEGIPPKGIVAFTFTERVAASLKSRIEKRVAGSLGEDFLNTLNGMFVGTIHSYCFRILQQHVARYETYDVLDEHRLTAFLTRYAYDLGLQRLENGRLFASIRTFLVNLDVVENEGVTLLIEGKGKKDEKDAAKWTAARRWIAAVNAWGKLGWWSHVVCYKRSEVGSAIGKALATADETSVTRSG